MTRRVVVLLLGIALGAVAPTHAQDADKADKAARKREALARWQAMSPEQRAELKRVHAAWVANASPEAKRELKRAMRERMLADEQASVDGRARERWKKLPVAQREKYKKLVHRLLSSLPAEERARLAQLPPEERREAVRNLIQSHRETVLERHLAAFPDDAQREQLRGELAGLRGKERFARLRKRLEGHVRDEAKKILASEAPRPEKVRRLRELLAGLPGEMRERMWKRFESELERRNKQPPQRPPARPDKPGAPPRDKRR